MVKKVAVLGAGNGGQATAADLSLYGHSVNLYEFPEYRANIDPIIERGGIEISGPAHVGFGKINKATVSIEEALKDVDVIISTVVANAHRTIAELCAPRLCDGQTVMLWGKGGGSLVFRKVMQDKNVKADIVLGECPTLPYGARRKGPAEVMVLSPLKSMTRIVGLPTRNTGKLVKVGKELYPDRDFFAPGGNALENIMLDGNAVTHPAVTLCNAGRIEFTKGEFLHWAEGFTKSVANLEAAIDEERIAIARALKLTGEALKPIRSSTWLGPTGLLSKVKAPPSLDNLRYITEDTPCGLVTYSSLGQMFHVPTPVIDSVITIFSAMLQRDFRSKENGARTVAELGFAGKTIDEIKAFVT
jgi:opine dehydrogenase